LSSQNERKNSGSVHHKRQPSIEPKTQVNHKNQVKEQERDHSLVINYGKNYFFIHKSKESKSAGLLDKKSHDLAYKEAEKRMMEILKQDEKFDNVYMEFSHQSINIPIFQKSDENSNINAFPENELLIEESSKQLLYGNNQRQDQKPTRSALNPNSEESKLEIQNITAIKQPLKVPINQINKADPQKEKFEIKNNSSKEDQFSNIEVPIQYLKTQFVNLLDAENNKVNNNLKEAEKQISNEKKLDKNINPNKVGNEPFGKIDETFDQLFAPKKSAENGKPLQQQKSQEAWFDFGENKSLQPSHKQTKDDWENVFNLQNTAFKDQSNKKLIQNKLMNDELDKLKTADPSLMNKDITSSQLKKFIFHEVSKSKEIYHPINL
jgi:hypothetical protein